LLYAQQADTIWRSSIAENTGRLRWMIGHVVDDADFVRTMRRGDQAALLALAEPRFRELQAQFNLSHWYFIGPDRRVVLRVHQPERAGDEIRRKTLLDAELSGQMTSGLELGTTATLTLRHVMPWRVAGTLIGYVEMGMEIESFADHIKRLTGLEVLTAVHKDYTSPEAFANGKKAFGLAGNWNDYPDIAILSQSLSRVPASLIDRKRSFDRVWQ
jgi:hypothetical protein